MSDVLPSSPTPALSTNQPPETSTLPVPLTPFVGREQEIETVTTLRRRPDVRLLTLTGPGGAGKTRLALRAIEDMRGDYADGVAFVSLAVIQDLELVLPTIAHLLRVPPAPGESPMMRLQTFLAGRNLLLLLDNFEHVLAAASQVTDLLARCPHVKVLCTSRVRLGVSGEHRVPVPPLSTDDASTLFAERAQAQVPTFTLEGETSSIVEAICTRLDGLPLAIELAAARITVLPPRALLNRLEHRLEVLTGGPSDVPVRLRTMRDAMSWSYDLLADEH